MSNNKDCPVQVVTCQNCNHFLKCNKYVRLLIKGCSLILYNKNRQHFRLEWAPFPVSNDTSIGLIGLGLFSAAVFVGGQIGLFWATDGKIRIIGCATKRSTVAFFVPELQSFSQWPPAIFGRFPKRVLARGSPKQARIAFSLLDHINHMGKGSTECTRINRRIAPSG